MGQSAVVRVVRGFVQGRALRTVAWRREIASALAQARLPSIAFIEEYAQDGGLMSYGPSWVEAYRRLAYFVDRIFKGAKPADLPVEQPTRFSLVVNAKTARALGIQIPGVIRLRAERVIERAPVAAGGAPSIRFSDLEALIKALGGTVVEREGSRVRIELSGEQWRCHRPHPGKEAKRYQVEEARELFERAGVEP